MHIINLSSGSKGNATFIELDGEKLLIDVGLSEKVLAERLSEIGEKLEDIMYVCVTHEHVDHIRGLETLAKKYDMEFYVHKKLKENAKISQIKFKEGKLHTFDEMPFSIGKFEVLPFAVSHDAVAPVGFVVRDLSSGAKAGFVTDLGTVSEEIKLALYGSKIVFIESNYDREMLWNGRYPYLLKKRIDGIHGHLSNEQSVNLAWSLYENGTKCFVLSHISENNNTYEKAYLNYVDFFEQKGVKLDTDVVIKVSFQGKHGNKFTVKE